LEKNRAASRPTPTSPRENTFVDTKTTTSWRTNKPTTTTTGPAPVSVPVRPKEEKPKKQFVKDDEGFISKGHVRGWERTDKPQDTQNPPKQSSTAVKKPEPNIDSNNIYASLEVDD